MHGLSEIKAINEHAYLKAQDESRRKRGLKPASKTGEVLRKTSSVLPRRTVKDRRLRLQGREVEIG